MPKGVAVEKEDAIILVTQERSTAASGTQGNWLKQQLTVNVKKTVKVV